MGQAMGIKDHRQHRQPVVQLSELAAAKLKLILWDEPHADRLCYRIVPITTGCGSTSFQITLTEANDGDRILTVSNIPFGYEEADIPHLHGLQIDLNRGTGNFELANPLYVPEDHDCVMPSGKESVQ